MENKQWQMKDVENLFSKPFLDLIYEAHTVHIKNFTANTVQVSQLLSIKTGSCPEDCAYCTQSRNYKTDVKKEKLMSIDEVLLKAKMAKENGAHRFCMGAAWRCPPKKDFSKVVEMVQEIKNMGLETCVTLGTLDDEQVAELKKAGLDYYNHNLDTSPEYYKKIITTRTYEERLCTLSKVRNAGINVCCGGIIGMGESREDRMELLIQLANLPKPPESVPINKLAKIEGTPLAQCEEIEDIEFVRTIASARIMMPKSFVRLSAGRETLSESTQALCFFAGANSIFYGEKLLTASNPTPDRDFSLLTKLGINFKIGEAQLVASNVES